MNSIILNDQNGVITDPKVLDHIRNTLKLILGDQVKITLLNVGIGKGEVVQLNEKSCSIKILELIKIAAPLLEIVVGISRPPTIKKILEHGTTFGVKNFHFYKAELSEKSYLDSKIFSEKQFYEFTRLGLAQSAFYAHDPEVSTYAYNPASKFETYEQKYILDLEAKESFQDDPIDFQKPIILSIGPERGFTRLDIDHFTKAGFKSIKISKSTLRVEHAVYAAIAQLEMLKGNL